MKIFNKVSIAAVAVSSALVLTVPLTALAATAPSLGAASTFSILAQTGITGTGTISGNVENNGIAAAITALTAAMVAGYTIYSSDGGTTGVGAPTTLLNAAVQDNASTAYYTTIPAYPIEGTAIVGAELNGITRGPGVYDLAGSPITLSGGVLTLDGPGTYIFRTTAGFTSSGSINFINGARACDVFWNVGSLATINGTSFAGTILSSTGVHFGAGVTLNGRALAVGGDVTLLGTIISGPTCAAAAAASGGGSNDGTITVVKTVINDSGGTKKVADFPLFVNALNVGHQSVISGETNTFLTNGLYPYTITETANANYTQTFSGDCDSTGFLNLRPGDQKVCIITNNDKGTPLAVVPPLIDVLKIANPLSLPSGPGPVTYTYTLRNLGTVPVTDITMVGDTCSPLVRVFGDTNANNKLEVSETWLYTCTQRLTATHTNTVTATGWANGISAVDIASATVVVGAPVVPPLIHVEKVPSRFTIPAPGGAVTYRYTVTNPGTVPLSNVTITDNKCTGLPGRVVGHPGDLNKNNLLESSESWSFTCQSNLTQTTTNTATASGEANGLTARDFAVATVVVASPKLPNTGFPPRENTTLLIVLVLAGAGIASVFFYRAKRNYSH